MAAGTTSYNRMVADRKHTLFHQLSGTVLEIGAGTGANLAFLPQGIRYLAIEPSLAMQGYLEAEAATVGIDLEIRTGIAEALPIADNSVDAVISTLVLCSVHDMQAAVAEILRVLKPGGQFRFIEHVAAPPATWTRRWQDWLNPAWQLLADGCHPNRETWRAVESAGFSQVALEHFQLPLGLSSPHIAGVATK
jgi:ubiquinone/menaquinone biosynthesis C-methylase UbiE